jgi:hypothetical protein
MNIHTSHNTVCRGTFCVSFLLVPMRSSNKICALFQSNGSCPFGPTCMYLHVNDANGGLEESTNQMEVSTGTAALDQSAEVMLNSSQDGNGLPLELTWGQV